MSDNFKESREVLEAIAEVAVPVVERLKDGFQLWKDGPVFLSMLASKKVRVALKDINKVSKEWKSRRASDVAEFLAEALLLASKKLRKLGK